MENIILALTNLYAIRAVGIAVKSNLPWQALAVAAAALASIAYHLIECQKHGMPGIGVFESMLSHRVFINIDRVAAIGAVVTLGSAPFVWSEKELVFLAFLSLVLSEGAEWLSVSHTTARCDSLDLAYSCL